MSTERTSPPPSPTPSPVSPPPPPTAQPPAPGDTGQVTPRWNVPTFSAAGWLAATGAVMLLIASIVVVAGRWETITPTARFSGLVATLLAIFFAAESGRVRLSSTSTALATLAAAITAPVGIAAAATISQPWPTCVMVGGLSALVATEVQSRRWKVPVLKAATVVAAGLAVTGVAAATPIPVAMLGAACAVVALVLGAERRSIALGAAVGATPALIVLAESGIGPGTIERIGAFGAGLSWSAPVSALIGALVVAVAAIRRERLELAGLSFSIALSGALTGIGHAQLDGTLVWSIPAVILLSLVVLAAQENVFGQLAARIVPIALTPMAVAAPLVAVVAYLSRAGGVADLDSLQRSALPIGLTAIALAVGAGELRKSASRAAFFGPVVAAATAMAAAGFVVLSEGSSVVWLDVAGAAAITCGYVALGRRIAGAWPHVAAVMTVIVVALATGAGGLGAELAALMLLGIALAGTGIAFLSPKVGAVDTLAVSGALAGVMLSFASAPAVVSLAAAVASAQALMYGLARRERTVVVAAGAVFASAAASLWWTSGVSRLAIEVLAPYSADGTDLALGAACAALLVLGALVRRFQSVTSWLAYSPGLGMATAWLLDSQLDENTTWATVGALAVGVVSVGIGGVRRLGAPLVIGTVIVGCTVIVSAGSRLAEAPTWAWLALGGVGLLTVAALIERSPKPLVSTRSADGSITDGTSLMSDFCRTFK